MIFTETNHPIAGIYPVANAFAGTVYTDIVNLKNAGHVTFLLYKGVGTTGTTLVTVEASSDAAGSAVQAVPFRYKKCASSTSEDTFGAVTEVAATGFTTAAASNEMYAIEVDAAEVRAGGYGFVRLKMVEQVANAVLGGVLIILSELRVQGAELPEAIS